MKKIIKEGLSDNHRVNLSDDDLEKIVSKAYNKIDDAMEIEYDGDNIKGKSVVDLGKYEIIFTFNYNVDYDKDGRHSSLSTEIEIETVMGDYDEITYKISYKLLDKIEDFFKEMING